MPSDATAPARYPSRKPWAGLGASTRATSSGTRATHPTTPVPNFGNESASRTPEKAARTSLRTGRPVEDLVRVEGGPYEDAGVDGAEPHSARLVPEPLEGVGRDVARDGCVAARGPQV